MLNLIYVYRGKSRDLRRIIVAILKSGFAVDIKKMNYVHNFLLKDSKVEKNDVKLVIISTENEKKLVEFLSENFPQFERIYLK